MRVYTDAKGYIEEGYNSYLGCEGYDVYKEFDGKIEFFGFNRTLSEARYELENTEKYSTYTNGERSKIFTSSNLDALIEVTHFVNVDLIVDNTTGEIVWGL